MKFCMVTTFYPPYHFGGDATYVSRLAAALGQRGHQVDVIHDREAYYLAHPGEPSSGSVAPPNVKVHALESPFGRWSPLLTHQTGRPFLKPALRQRLTEGAYDVIHFHNTSLIGAGALAYGDAVKLYTTHEYWLLCPLSLLWKYGRELCDRRECVRCTLQAGRPPQLWRFGSYLSDQLKHVDRFIAPSRFTRDRHLADAADLPFDVLPHFLPTPAVAVEGKTPHPRPYFLFVGRLIEVKGLQTVLPAFAGPDGADLLIAGEGDYEPELRAAAQAYPRVQFLGAQPYERLRSLYRHAIALIVPSICYEVFGLVLIEAFAEGTPVIARDLGGMSEVVEQSKGGVTFRDHEGLVRAIDYLAGNAVARSRLGANGHDAYLRLWSEEPHLTGYFEIIERARLARRQRIGIGS
jgi:glycosyltransferase involved in cell wall biosynthesis